MGTWFVTGCSSGLGRGIAEAALRTGERVIMTARNTDKLNDLLEEYPKPSAAVYMELNDVESMNKAISDGAEKLGEIDVLVNNAGHGYRATVEESEVSGIEEVFISNFFAPAHIVRRILPSMRKRRTGIIVNVSSIGGVRGALGIRTMLVEPGAFQTSFYGDNLAGSSIIIEDYQQIAESYRKEYVDPSAAKTGDPEKGGQVIVDVIRKGDIPQRLLLGSDALKMAEATYQSKLDELHRWADTSRLSDAD